MHLMLLITIELSLCRKMIQPNFTYLELHHYTCNPNAWQKIRNTLDLILMKYINICNGLSHLTHKTHLTRVSDLEKVLTTHILH